MDEDKIDGIVKLLQAFVSSYEKVIENENDILLELCHTAFNTDEIDSLMYSYYSYNSGDSFSKFTYMKQMEVLIKGRIPTMVMFIRKVNNQYQTSIFGVDNDELTALMS